MATNRTIVDAPPSVVFAVLLDPYEYPKWVVGAHRIRDVDLEWPGVGSAFYHRSGGGAIDDKSEIVEISEPKRIVLRAKLRPLGIALVEIDVVPRGERTEIVIREYPEPGTKLALITPLLGPPFYLRNIEALRRLRNRIKVRAASA